MTFKVGFLAMREGRGFKNMSFMLFHLGNISLLILLQNVGA